MAFCKLHDEYWAVNLESLSLDTLSNTETSKPCIISKHGLVVHKSNILLSEIVEWTPILDRGHGSNTSDLDHNVSTQGKEQEDSVLKTDNKITFVGKFRHANKK